MPVRALFLATALLGGVVFSSDQQPARSDNSTPGKPIAAAGVLTDNKPAFAMVWVDGEEGPTKFVFAEGFDKNTFGFPPKCKGVFVPDRVRFTYVKGDDGNKLLAMDRDKTPLQGTVTGEVHFSNDFWVAVKPRNGPMDGYAINWPPGDMVAKLKSLQKGDWVTIRFHTDVERHRIEALRDVPKPPAPAVLKAPTSRPDSASTTQPAVADLAGGRLRLAQVYIDNEMKDKAREILLDLVRSYPNTPAAKAAEAKLKELGG